jgi:outer membrane protein assembly factor BamB
MKPTYALIALIAALLNSAIHVAPAAEPSPAQWPQFRGPNGNAVALGQSIPLAFGPEKNVRWKVELPAGNSSPCIWEDRIFLTGHAGTSLQMICLRRSDGHVLWQHDKTMAKLNTYVHSAAGPANSTPATDGRLVVFQFGDFGVIVTDLAGLPKWEKPLAPNGNPFGYGASPVLDDGSIYLDRDAGLDSCVLCLEAATGKERWRAARPHAMPSFCTPYVLSHRGAKQILVGGSGRLVAYDAATGDEVWHVGGLPAIVCPSPVAAGGMIYFGGWTTAHATGLSRVESFFDEDSGVSAKSMRDPAAFFAQFDLNHDGRLSIDEFPKGRGKDAFNLIDANKDGFIEMEELAPFYSDHQDVPGRNVILAIAAGGKGDVTQSNVKWEATKALPYVSSPLVYRGRLYFVKSGGFLTCLDARTGRAHYEAERLGLGGEYYATPVAVGEHIVVCAQRGTVFVVGAGDQLDIAASNVLGESIYATPAIVENTLYVRTDHHLWAFAE